MNKSYSHRVTREESSRFLYGNGPRKPYRVNSRFSYQKHGSNLILIGIIRFLRSLLNAAESKGGNILLISGCR